jgi:hypothetical protein
MFISRVELLPEDETTAEHDEAKRIEAQLIETDRTTRTDGETGLFKGAFCKPRLQMHGPIRDEEDGVLRCPVCAWEMEDGECGQCGYADFDGEFSGDEDHEDETIDSRSVISIDSSILDRDEEDPEYINPFLIGHPVEEQNHFREWVRRDQAARRARRAARENERNHYEDRASTADTEPPDLTTMGRYHDNPGYGLESGDDEEMAAFLERHPYDDHRWNTDTAETGDEDEEMTSAMDEEDAESATSFHRAAIIARDRGLNPPFESDISITGSQGDGDGETATNGSDSSDDSTASEDESDTPEPSHGVQRLASRPARIIIDSDDDDDESSETSSSEEDDTDGNNGNNDDDDETETSSDEDSTPSPPRPAAVRQARLQMQRGRRPGRGRGRPRAR